MAVAAFLFWQSSRAVRVGVLLPFTGPQRELGLGMRNAIRLAADEVNARGGFDGRPVRLVEVDESPAPDTAATQAQALVADQRVVGVIGGGDYDAFLREHLVFGAAKMPFIPGATTERGLPSVGLGSFTNEFSLLPFGSATFEKSARYAWNVLGARRIVYVRETGSFALAHLLDFQAAVNTVSGTTTAGEEVLGSEANVPALVKRLADEPPDFIHFAGSPKLAAAFLAQLRTAGVKAPFQAGLHAPVQEFIAAAGEEAEGALAAFPALPAEDTPGGREFLRAYEAARFAEPPSPFGVIAYAEAQALFGAIAKSFRTRPSVRGALANEALETALGTIRFNYVGSSYQTAAVYQVTRGAWKPIYVNGPSGIAPYVAR